MAEYVAQGNNVSVLFREFEKYAWTLPQILQVFLSLRNIVSSGIFASVASLFPGVHPGRDRRPRGRASDPVRRFLLEGDGAARAGLRVLPHLQPAVGVPARVVVRNQARILNSKIDSELQFRGVFFVPGYTVGLASSCQSPTP